VEGGFRVPTWIRWPGVIKPGQVLNDICSHEDFIPTFAAAAGEPDLVNKVLKGYKANGKSSRFTSTATTCSLSSKAR